MSDPFKGALEDRALEASAAMTIDERSTLSVMEVCAISAAVSAKRQADALECIASSLEHLDVELAHPEWGIAPTIRRAQR